MVRSIKNPKKAKRKNKGSKGEASAMPTMPTKVWRPGVDQIEEDEELQCDPTAYNSLHAFHVGWPCLSFDILRDSLGLVRSEFPHTMFFVAVTQAEKSEWNSIGVYKISNISGKRRDLIPPKPAAEGSEMDSDGSDEDSEDEADSMKDPVLQLRQISHEGCVNRICSMTQSPHIVASWADTGHVQLSFECPGGIGGWDESNHTHYSGSFTKVWRTPS